MSNSFSSLDYGEQLVIGYRASGLTRREFSSQAGVPVSTLDYYVRRERKALSAPRLVPNRLLPVDVIGVGDEAAADRSPSLPGGVLIRLANGRAVEVGRGFDAELLLDLLAVLEGNKREERR